MSRLYTYGTDDNSSDKVALETIVSEVKSHTDARLDNELKVVKEGIESLKQNFKDLAQQGAMVGHSFDGGGVKTIGSELTAHGDYSALRDRRVKRLAVNVAVKNTILGESGNPQNPNRVLAPADRLPGVVSGPLRTLSILDFVPSGVTGANLVEYTRESSWSNNAAETSEGGSKPESDLTFSLESSAVRTVAHWLKISRQALDDAPSVASYIDTRMSHGVRQRLEAQIVAGNGTSPNLSGLTASGNYTAFVPDVLDTALDSINRAKYSMISTDHTPAAVLLHPADFGRVERTKADASSNAYAVGDGNGLQYVSSGLVQIWGLQVIVSNHVPQGSFIMLDPSAVMLFVRQEATVEMFEQDGDNVQKNLVTVRAELRAAFTVFNAAGVVYGDLEAAS